MCYYREIFEARIRVEENVGNGHIYMIGQDIVGLFDIGYVYLKKFCENLLVIYFFEYDSKSDSYLMPIELLDITFDGTLKSYETYTFSYEPKNVITLDLFGKILDSNQISEMINSLPSIFDYKELGINARTCKQ